MKMTGCEKAQKAHQKILDLRNSFAKGDLSWLINDITDKNSVIKLGDQVHQKWMMTLEATASHTTCFSFAPTQHMKSKEDM